MTVATTTNRQDFVCASGALGPISFPHRIDAPGDLQLWIRDEFGFQLAQAIQNVDYFVAVATDFESATVTLAAAFATANDGETCSLLRIVPLTQPLGVASVQRFSDGELEKAYDQGVMRTQQIEESIASLREIVDVDQTAAALQAAVDLVAAQVLQSINVQKVDEVTPLLIRFSRHDWARFR